MAGDFNLLEAVRAVFASDMTPFEKLVALALLNHWSRNRDTFPSAERLAKWTSLGRRSVLRAITALEAKGAIAVARSPGRANRYELGPLMALTSAPQAPVPTGHQCPIGTQPVPIGHPTSAPQAPEVIQEEIQEEIQVRDLAATSAAHPEPARARRPSKPKTPRPPKPERTAEQKQAHQRLTDQYFSEFERIRGCKPIGWGGKEAHAVYELLDKCAGDERKASELITSGLQGWDKATIAWISANPSACVAGGRKGPQGGVRAGDLLDRQLRRVEALEAQELAKAALQ